MEPTTGQWSLPNAPREGETNAFEGPVSYRHERERAKEGGEMGVFGEENDRYWKMLFCVFLFGLPPIMHCLTC